MGPCVEHTQPKGSAGGYASVKHDGEVTTLHRVVYCRANGLTLAAIRGTVVRHKCDNRRCINPQHLEIGTHKDNTADMMERGRHKFVAHPGEANGTAKLTEEQVLYIRAAAIPQRALAREMGVSQGLISHIRLRKAWRHV